LPDRGKGDAISDEGVVGEDATLIHFFFRISVFGFGR
jgi:hypothetical protein